MEEHQQLLGPYPQPQSLVLLPAIQAFRGDLVVRGHLGDPVGEKTKSEGRRELPATMEGSSVRAGKPWQEARQRTQATHTCGPGCEELPIHSPGAPWVGVGVAKEGERL